MEIDSQTIFVTLSAQTIHSPHFVETEINTPSESTFIADQNGTYFFQSDFPVQILIIDFELLNANNTQVDFDCMWYL